MFHWNDEERKGSYFLNHENQTENIWQIHLSIRI